MSRFRRFVEERKLVKMSVDRKLVLKEVEGAVSDLEEARDTNTHKKLTVALQVLTFFISLTEFQRALRKYVPV